MNDWLQCVGNGLRRFVNGDFGQTIAGFIAIFLAGLIFIVISAAVSGQWEVVGIYVGAMLFAALLFFGIWFVIELLALLVWCGIAVIQRGLDAGAPGAPTVVGALIASGSVTTCQSAQVLLAQAQAVLAAAQAARDAQAQRVGTASARVRSATSMLVAAAAERRRGHLAAVGHCGGPCRACRCRRVASAARTPARGRARCAGPARGGTATRLGRCSRRRGACRYAVRNVPDRIER